MSIETFMNHFGAVFLFWMNLDFLNFLQKKSFIAWRAFLTKLFLTWQPNRFCKRLNTFLA